MAMPHPERCPAAQRAVVTLTADSGSLVAAGTPELRQVEALPIRSRGLQGRAVLVANVDADHGQRATVVVVTLA